MALFSTTQEAVNALVIFPCVAITSLFGALLVLVVALGAGALVLQSVNTAGGIVYDAFPVLVEHLATAVVVAPQVAWGLPSALLSLPVIFSFCFTVDGHRPSMCEQAPAWDAAMPWADRDAYDGPAAWYEAQRGQFPWWTRALRTLLLAALGLFYVGMTVAYVLHAIKTYRWPAWLADWAWPRTPPRDRYWWCETDETPVRELEARAEPAREPEPEASADPEADSVAARVSRRRQQASSSRSVVK